MNAAHGHQQHLWAGVRLGHGRARCAVPGTAWPHGNTTSYCAGFIVGSALREIGLPMKSLSPARCWLSSPSGISTTVALAATRDRVFEIPRAHIPGGVDVDRCKRLGPIDDQTAAALQVDPPRQHAHKLSFDAEQVEHRPLATVQLELAH